MFFKKAKRIKELELCIESLDSQNGLLQKQLHEQITRFPHNILENKCEIVTLKSAYYDIGLEEFPKDFINKQLLTSLTEELKNYMITEESIGEHGEKIHYGKIKILKLF